jgi:hypothetical protein
MGRWGPKKSVSKVASSLACFVGERAGESIGAGDLGPAVGGIGKGRVDVFGSDVGVPDTEGGPSNNGFGLGDGAGVLRPDAGEAGPSKEGFGFGLGDGALVADDETDFVTGDANAVGLLSTLDGVQLPGSGSGRVPNFTGDLEPVR